MLRSLVSGVITSKAWASLYEIESTYLLDLLNRHPHGKPYKADLKVLTICSKPLSTRISALFTPNPKRSS